MIGSISIAEFVVILLLLGVLGWGAYAVIAWAKRVERGLNAQEERKKRQ